MALSVCTFLSVHPSVRQRQFTGCHYDCDLFLQVMDCVGFNYSPQTKLQEGNVFTSVCHSVQGGGWVCMLLCDKVHNMV